MLFYYCVKVLVMSYQLLEMGKTATHSRSLRCFCQGETVAVDFISVDVG